MEKKEAAMTNEQIVEQSSNGGKEFVNMYDMMELARQDEREKLGMKQLTGTDLNKLFELYLDKKLKSMLDIDKEVKL